MWVVIIIIAGVLAFAVFIGLISSQTQKERVASEIQLKQQVEKELSNRYNAGWMAGRDYGYYQSFIDSLYCVNEYSFVPKNDKMIILKTITMVPHPHTELK